MISLARFTHLIEREIVEHVEQNNERSFYIGTKSPFDRMSQQTLRAAVELYPHIRAHIALAYYEPKHKEEREQYKLPTLYDYVVFTRNKEVLYVSI